MPEFMRALPSYLSQEPSPCALWEIMHQSQETKKKWMFNSPTNEQTSPPSAALYQNLPQCQTGSFDVVKFNSSW